MLVFSRSCSRVAVAAAAALFCSSLPARVSATEVYLTPVLANDLGDLATANQWSGVRQRLSGCWFNSAGSNVDQVRRILQRSPGAQKVVVPISFSFEQSGFRTLHPALTKLNEVRAVLPADRVLRVDLVAFDCVSVTRGDQNVNDAADLVREAATNSVFEGAKIGVTFSPWAGTTGQSHGVGTYLWRARKLMDAANGAVAVEMSPWRFRLPNAKAGFFQLQDEARARGLDFHWLMNRGTGLDNDRYLWEVNNSIEILRNAGRLPEIIAVANHGIAGATDLLPLFPERNADGTYPDTLTAGLNFLQNEVEHRLGSGSSN